jgi:pilus assembly protein CpaB
MDVKAAENRIAVANIMPGSPITETSLAPASSSSGVLSFIIPEGHRAITVAVNEVVGVAGFILPNSIVDVVATVNSPYTTSAQNNRISKIILQNVKVLAVGQILEQKDGKPVTVPTVTLDVLPMDAEKLAIASENKVQLILSTSGTRRGEDHQRDSSHHTGRAPAERFSSGGEGRAENRPPRNRQRRPYQPYSVDAIQGTKGRRKSLNKFGRN